MLNHITLRVSDFEKSQDFFSKALEPLGYKILKKDKDENIDYTSVGYAVIDKEGHRDFWVKKVKDYKVTTPSFSCLAFTATSKEMVNEFHKAAIEAGGKDNGKPGYRVKYHPGYYAAYVLDPDGYNIEAVFDDMSMLDK
ncbi:MAG: VOC family protein [bacterium]